MQTDINREKINTIMCWLVDKPLDRRLRWEGKGGERQKLSIIGMKAILSLGIL